MESLCVKFHHEGYFMDEGMTNYVGQLSTWEVDPDKWSYFEVVGILKELGYVEWIGIWYDINGVKKLLENDKGAMEMCQWAETNGCVHMYIIHPISQPQLNDQTDIPPGPQLNEPTSHLRSFLKAHDDPKPQKPAQPKTVPIAHITTQPQYVREGNIQQNEIGGEGDRGQNETVGKGDRGQNEIVEVHVRIDHEDESVFLQQDGYDSDDNDTAQKERFNDSDDEKGEFDGFDPVQQDEVATQQQELKCLENNKSKWLRQVRRGKRLSQRRKMVGKTKGKPKSLLLQVLKHIKCLL